MLLCYFSLFLGLCAGILHSKDLQTDISSQLPTPRDLLKTRLVDKNWVAVEKVFNRITPTAGLFEHKQTNEIVFETKKNSWHQTELVDQMQNSSNFQSWVEEKNWNQVFGELAYASTFTRSSILWWRGEFLKGLAEIVDVTYQFTAMYTCFETLYVSPPMPFLHCIAYQFFDDADAIEILLDRGAEIDETDVLLRSPTMTAAIYGNENVVKTLLRHGADPNLRESYYRERTALHYAAAHDNLPIIEILLNNGAEIDASDKWLKRNLENLGISSKRKRKNKNIKRF